MIELDSLGPDEPVSVKNKRIAKNALFLYCRMLLGVLVNLYASRLLLDKLGVSEYGIYNIVGGVVALMMFVNTAMQGASSRFITYSLGRNDIKDLQATVNASVHIHFLICVLFILVGETVGLWFVNSHLNIPDGRMEAANWVFQFAILTSGFSILRVPFSALVISYERMNVYAYIELFDVIARCAILFLLPLFFDRLIAYSSMMLVISVIVSIIYLLYCKNHLQGFNISKRHDKTISKPMVSFAAWSLFGEGTYALYQQGTNVIINNFFGVVVNAASGVATQASAVVSTFVANVQSAFNPQIIKEFSVDNIERMRQLMIRELEIMIYLSSLLFVPLFLNMDFIMDLWLKDVPPYSVVFCQIMLICNVFQIITNVLSTAIRATGYNRVFSFFVGLINIVGIILVWLFFKFGSDVYFAYIVTLMLLFMKSIVEGFLLNHYECRIKVWNVLAHTIRPFLFLAFSLFLCWLSSRCFANDIITLLVSIMGNAVIITFLYYATYPQYRILLSKLLNIFRFKNI